MLSSSEHVEHCRDFCGKRTQQNWRAKNILDQFSPKNAVDVVVTPLWGQELG